MRTLYAVQLIIASAFLLLGLVALFGIGITGLLFLVPGIIFAAIAGSMQAPSRAAVVLALAADSVLAYFAARKLEALLSPDFAESKFEPAVAALMKPSLIDILVPSVTITLVACAAVALLLDWRALRAAPWFVQSTQAGE